MEQPQARNPAQQAGSGSTAESLSVLNLVTNDEAPFYRQQVTALERANVTATTRAVPGTHRRGDTAVRSRSLLDYVRFYRTVLGEARTHYDLVHANYGLTGPAAIAQPKRPVVLSLWGSDLYGRYGAVSKWCARRADAVIVMSDAMARRLDTDCHVIPHGVDFDLFRPIPQSTARSDVGWEPDRKHVLFPYAKTRAEKDFPRAERVVDRARSRLDSAIELHSVHDIPHERMPVYMNAADVLLLTSSHEGSPNSVKEALACELPVVSTDVGDVSERLDGVSPGGVGRTTDDLVAELLEVLEQGTRSNGREQSEGLSLEYMAAQIRGVYESVLD